jgi:hypothetical protein
VDFLDSRRNLVIFSFIPFLSLHLPQEVKKDILFVSWEWSDLKNAMALTQNGGPEAPNYRIQADIRFEQKSIVP